MKLRYGVSNAKPVVAVGEDSVIAHGTQNASTSLEAKNEVAVLGQSNPTDDYGVAVARVTFAKGTFIAGIAEHHMIGISCSNPIPAEHMIDGTRLDHHIAPGSLCLCPAEATHSTVFGGSLSGIVLQVSPECLALATAEYLGRNSDLIEQINGRDSFIAHVAHVLDAEAAHGLPNGILCIAAIKVRFVLPHRRMLPKG